MRRVLYLLLSVLFLSLSMQAFSQGKKDKKKKKKANVEAVEAKPVEIQKEPVNTGKEVVPVDAQKQPVDNAVIKPVNLQEGKKPALTLEQVIPQSKPVVQTKPNGSINWTEQFIEARGQSVIDNQKFTNPAQAKLMATRGAVVVAQRNLLEIIQGVNITSETTVKDMITQSDYIYSRVDGVVKGAQQIGEAIEKDGFIEVTLRIPIYSSKGLAPVVYDNVPGKEKKTTVSDVTQVAEVLESGDIGGAEGFVFNFNGKQIDPSMFPIVVDENGNTLLDFYKLYDPTTGKFPQMLETSKDMFKQLGFDKGVEIIDVAQSFNGKIQLDQLNAGKINWDKIGKVAQTAGKVIKFALALI